MNDPNDVLREAIALQQAGDLAGAERVFLTALAAGQNHQNMYIGLASICDMQGRLPEACEALKRGAVSHGEDPSILSNLGSTLQRLGQAEAAISHLEKAATLAPNFMPAHQGLTIAYAGIGDWPKAQASVELALSIESDSPLMLQMSAYINVESRNFAKSLAAYERLSDLKNLHYRTPNSNPGPELTQKYSRQSPSPRYAELSQQYALMHSSEQAEHGNMFAGVVTFLRVAPLVRKRFKGRGYRSALDYGGGQGRQYDLTDIQASDETLHSDMASYLNVGQVDVYDAGRPGTDSNLGQKYDAVICTDVLEHIDERDLPWVVRELFEHAEKAVFATIATYPAVKRLPNGENAHCTLKPSEWWSRLFTNAARDFPSVTYTYLVVNDKAFENIEAFNGGPDLRLEN